MWTTKGPSKPQFGGYLKYPSFHFLHLSQAATGTPKRLGSRWKERLTLIPSILPPLPVRVLIMVALSQCVHWGPHCL